MGTDSLGEAVESCAKEYDTCIRIFKRTYGNVFVEAASADVNSDCTVHHLSEEKLKYYYNQTVFGEGIYTENKEINHNLGKFWSEGETKLFEVFDRSEKIYGIVHNLFVTAEDGTQYMVMLNSVLTPVNATVKTLKTQFLWICIVLLLGAFLLAFFDLAQHFPSSCGNEQGGKTAGERTLRCGFQRDWLPRNLRARR